MLDKQELKFIIFIKETDKEKGRLVWTPIPREESTGPPIWPEDDALKIVKELEEEKELYCIYRAEEVRAMTSFVPKK